MPSIDAEASKEGCFTMSIEKTKKSYTSKSFFVQPYNFADKV